MSENTTDLTEEKLVSLQFIADSLGLSTREVNRNKKDWTGFPSELDLGHRTKRYSYRSFQIWLKEFIKQKSEKPKEPHECVSTQAKD